jgi:hypothetical protein
LQPVVKIINARATSKYGNVRFIFILASLVIFL